MSPAGRTPRTTTIVLLAVVTVLPLGTGIGRAAPDRSELSSARARLMELERDFHLVVERYNLVNERFTSLQATIGRTESEISRITERMRLRRRAAVELATELYKSGRAIPLEGILSSRSLAELETKVDQLHASGQAHARVFERLAVDRTVLDRKVEILERAQGAALQARTDLDVLRASIEEKIAAQEHEVAELRAAIEAAERRAAAEAARRAALAATRPVTTALSGVPARPAPAPNARAQTAVDAALSQVGKPYRWGAAGPDSYDCSGLTMWAWAHAGVGLPHNSGAQYAATPRVARGDLQPGDLMFFGSPIHHVGMYIGNGQMVEAPYSGNSVRVVSAGRSDFVGAGRPGV